MTAAVLTACAHGRAATDATTAIRPSGSSILVVRAVGTLGWIKPSRDADTWVNGLRGAATFRLTKTAVVATSLFGQSTKTATTDQHGIAQFTVRPGRYRVRLADGSNCDAVAAGATVAIAAHHTIHVQVTCEQP